MSPGKWIASGQAATLDTKDGSLALHYTVNPAGRNMAVLPLRGLPIAAMKSLRFEIRTDMPFAAGIVFSEKKPGGGNYMAVIWSDGDTWQPVILTPRDFTEADGARDPVDPDHKLDLDQVRDLALLDLTQFSDAAVHTERVYSEPHTGVHTISVRTFEISGQPASPVPSNSIDDFSRPQCAWFTPGGAAFSQHDGALTVRYRQMPEQWISWSRLIPPGDYTGATHLAMDIQSDRDAQLAISIRERRADGSPGKRYNVDFRVAGGKTPEHREVVLSAFHTEDGASGLRTADLQTITFLDVSRESDENQIRIRDLRLVKR